MTKADWLRSEIEKLELIKKKYDGKNEVAELYGAGYNQALTSIITRYREELKVLESK